MRKEFALLVLLLLFGCTAPSETEKIMAQAAKKASALETYKVEYRRNIVSYVNPNESIHLIPTSTITKYKKNQDMRIDSVDWLNTSVRLYKISNEYLSCSFNTTWTCGNIPSSQMQEFLGYNVPDPAASISRQVSEGALVLGSIKQDSILNRTCDCFALEIRPDRFTQKDWDEYVLGSVASKENANLLNNLMVWQCLDKETGMKLEVILNYKTQIDGEERTVEINMKATGFEPNKELDDSLFEPGR